MYPYCIEQNVMRTLGTVNLMEPSLHHHRLIFLNKYSSEITTAKASSHAVSGN